MFWKVLGSEWCCLLVILAITSGYWSEVSGVVCPHCNKDFKSLGRHIWRCKSKVVIDNVQVSETRPTESVSNEIEIPERSLANNDRVIEPTNDPPDIREDKEDEDYSCYCGKVCKGLRGLQAHKRCCRILDISDIKALFENPIIPEEIIEEPVDEVILDEYREYHEKLCGIKLPTTKAEWDLANEHFRIIFYDENISVLNDYVKNVQSSVYNYFRDNYGTVVKENSMNNFGHYNNMSNRKLKVALSGILSSGV